MPDGFRFRCNWRGKLILQRYVEWTEWAYPGVDHQCAKWRDATVEDMNEFFKPKGQVTP